MAFDMWIRFDDCEILFDMWIRFDDSEISIRSRVQIV